MRKFLAVLYLTLFASIASVQADSPAPGVPVSGNVINRSTVNSSKVITTGNTFQTILPSILGTTTQRQSLTIENNNASDGCWITFGVLANGTKITVGNAAVASSILLLAGEAYTRYWPYVPSDEFEATCATSSDTLYVDTQ